MNAVFLWKQQNIQVTYYEPCHEKTCFMYMRKERCSADQHICFGYIDKTVQSLYFLDPKFQVSIFFVSDLVGNPEDRFSHDEAPIKRS